MIRRNRNAFQRKRRSKLSRFAGAAMLGAASLVAGGALNAPAVAAAQTTQQQQTPTRAVVPERAVTQAVSRLLIAKGLHKFYRRQEPIWIGRMRQGASAGRNAFWRGGRR